MGTNILAIAIRNNDYVVVNNKTMFQEDQESNIEICGFGSSYHSIYSSDSDSDDDVIEYEKETYKMDNENLDIFVVAKYAGR